MPSPKNLPPLHSAAAVHYAVSVIDPATGRTVRRLPRKKNLILDQGLDGIAVRTWAESFTHAAVGTGTTPTRRASGAVTVSQAGSTLTASAGFFEAADVGRLFKFDTGEEVRILVHTSGVSVEVDTTATVPASAGTIWYVNQTSLTTETKRSGAYAQDSGSNGTSFLGGIVTHKRTFLFSAESGTVTYREIGWSHTASSGANLFGRDLLAGSGVTLVNGQQLKVSVELSVEIFPAASAPWLNTVTGFSHDGQHGCELFGQKKITATGGLDAWPGPMEIKEKKALAVLSDTTAIRPIADADRRVSTLAISAELTGSSYSSGSFQRHWSHTFSISQAVSTSIRGYALGGNLGGQITCGYRVLLDAPETKDSDHTLSLTFTLSWGRVLTN